MLRFLLALPILNTFRALPGLQGIHAVPLFKTIDTCSVGRLIAVNPLEQLSVSSSMSAELKALFPVSISLNGSDKEVQTKEASVRSCGSEDIAGIVPRNCSKL